MLTVAAARSYSGDNAVCYVLPVLWITSRFHKWAIWRVSGGRITQQRSVDGLLSLARSVGRVAGCVLDGRCWRAQFDGASGAKLPPTLFACVAKSMLVKHIATLTNYMFLAMSVWRFH